MRMTGRRHPPAKRWSRAGPNWARRAHRAIVRRSSWSSTLAFITASTRSSWPSFRPGASPTRAIASNTTSRPRATPSCGSIASFSEPSRWSKALFEPDAGVGDDLLPGLGFLGDVGRRLVDRAAERHHALLGIGVAHLGCGEGLGHQGVQDDDVLVRHLR